MSDKLRVVVELTREEAEAFNSPACGVIAPDDVYDRISDKFHAAVDAALSTEQAACCVAKVGGHPPDCPCECHNRRAPEGEVLARGWMYQSDIDNLNENEAPGMIHADDWHASKGAVPVLLVRDTKPTTDDGRLGG